MLQAHVLPVHLELAEFADARGLVLRAYGVEGVRATIAEQEANDLLIEIAAAWLDRSQSQERRD